jgi:hypothetical protein
MSTLRNNLENTNAALVLVLLVVASASTGIRLAGVLAALASAVWFDFFLTAPYLAFAIIDRADIETTILLVLVGLAVSEVAYWGRKQQGKASRHEGFLAGVIEAAGVVAGRLADGDAYRSCGTSNGRDSEPRSLCLQVHDQRRAAGPAAERNSCPGWQTLDIDRFGLPTDSQIQLVARVSPHGRNTHSAAVVGGPKGARDIGRSGRCRYCDIEAEPRLDVNARHSGGVDPSRPSCAVARLASARLFRLGSLTLIGIGQ